MNRILTTVASFSKRALVMAFFSKKGTCQNFWGGGEYTPTALPTRSRRPCRKMDVEFLQCLKKGRAWSTKKNGDIANSCIMSDEYRYVFTIVFVVAISVADSCDVIDKRQEGFILGCALDRFTFVTNWSLPFYLCYFLFIYIWCMFTNISFRHNIAWKFILSIIVYTAAESWQIPACLPMVVVWVSNTKNV